LILNFDHKRVKYFHTGVNDVNAVVDKAAEVVAVADHVAKARLVEDLVVHPNVLVDENSHLVSPCVNVIKLFSDTGWELNKRECILLTVNIIH
jgi:hypothetical protein